MRILVWFTIGFSAACAAGAYGELPALLSGISLALGLLLLLISGRRLHFRIAALLLLGISLGSFWFARFEGNTLAQLSDYDGQVVETQIRCSGFPEETDYGIRVEGSVTVDGREQPVLVYLDDTVSPEPGMTLSGPFRFHFTAPGGQRESSYYQGEGIFLLAYQTDDLLISDGDPGLRDFPAKLRLKIQTALDALLPENVSGFAKALLIGDSSDLDYATKTDFSVSGIRHIVAVSGLHVSILFSLFSILSFHRRSISGLLGFPVLLLFAAVTGFTPSVCRACLMSGLMLLSDLFNQEYDGPTALSFAALVLLLVNPLVITSVSYQLSFASVTGIFLFAPGIRKWLQSFFDLKGSGKAKRGFVRWFTLGVSVTLGATTATVPLCAYYFGTVSLAAVLTNLLVLWIISFVFYGLIVMCLLSGIWTSGAAFLGNILAVCIRYVMLTAKTIAKFPLAAVYTRSRYIVFWLVFVYILLAVFLLSKNKKPVTLCCCAILGLCLSLLASWTEPRLDDVRFTVLDVGQGQCLLLQSEGKNFLVDCGGSSDETAADIAAQTLLSQGIPRLDGMILTHLDRDHAGGAEKLLTRIPADLLILPPVHTDMDLPAGRTLYGCSDLCLEFGEVKMMIYSGSFAGSNNENSICILFDTKNCDILVTGDRSGLGERLLLRKAHIPDVDILVAGHHGSKNATCEELLLAAKPEIVCISAGAGIAYGHPAPELLERLKTFGCSVYRTDLHGDILIRR